jgi:hypothetical protein
MTSRSLYRRDFLRIGAAAITAVSGGLSDSGLAAAQESFPPTRVITGGPRHHWFGYYDKLQFDPTSRYVLGMAVEFEGRSPTAGDTVRVGMVDLEDNDRWVELGSSSAWNWQQGCMLQWRPRSQTEVLWNDRQGDKFVCHILDTKSGTCRTLPSAVYSVSPDGKSAVTTDFRRIADVRPGYGYAGPPDPYADDLAPEESGIQHVDLETGETKLILSIAEIARRGDIPQPEPGIKHYFNHLLISPDGRRFIALHRWRYPNGRRLTRLLTANLDGSDVRIVIPNGYASHFIWRDTDHILVQSRHWLGIDEWDNFLVEDQEGGGKVSTVGRGVLDPSGHPSYLPGNEWILSDTYPRGSDRMQTPHLFHVPTGKRIDLGHFHSPAQFTGEWRVDTHPRFSPDLRYVCIDSPHGDQGRQLHLIDISAIVPSPGVTRPYAR